MKLKRTIAAITVFALVCSASPVTPFADVFEKAAITANAAEANVTWNVSKIWNAINSWGCKSVIISDTVPSAFSGITVISSDEKVKATNGANGTLIIFSADGGKVKAPENCYHMFDPVYYQPDDTDVNTIKEQLTSIDCSGLDTSEVTNMAGMFANNSNLSSLKISGFDTKNVTDMNYMFTNSTALSSIDVSSFNTEKVTNMSSMFCYCTALTSLDLSNFDTKNVTNMNRMFGVCQQLKSLNLGGKFNTSKVTDMNYMFGGLLAIETLDLSTFNTQNVTDMGEMFDGCGCSSIVFGDNFNTGKVTNMQNMFSQMHNITSLDLSFFDTGNVTNMSEMFSHDNKLISLNLSNFNIEKVTDMSKMISWNQNLENLDITNFVINSGTNIEEFSDHCPDLKAVKCSQETFEKLGFDPANVKRTAVGSEAFILEGYSLDISEGCFTLNVYMDLPVLDEAKAFVRFTLPDGSNKDIPITKALIKTVRGKGYTVFPVEVAAKDMSSRITVNVYEDENTTVSGEGTVSVKEYAEALKESDRAYESFINAMLNYGAYADAYFNDKTYNPMEYKTAFYGEISQNMITSNGKVTQENYVGTTLLLKNKVILRHYFSQPVEGAVQKGNLWYVEKAFNPTQFDKKIGDYNYTVNDYIKNALSGSYPAKLKNLCTSLYVYSYNANLLLNS